LPALLGLAVNVTDLGELALDPLDVGHLQRRPVNKWSILEATIDERREQRLPKYRQPGRPMGGGFNAARLGHRNHRPPWAAAVINADLNPLEHERREWPLRAVTIFRNCKLPVGYIAGLRINIRHDGQHEVRIGSPGRGATQPYASILAVVVDRNHDRAGRLTNAPHDFADARRLGIVGLFFDVE
jgi:hypothetical protein